MFDILNHPQADLGLELPSLLHWKNHADKAVDHVVLGKGPPGGAWQTMDGFVLTISLGCWMELPNLSFREWEARQESKCCRESRASVASVAQYYCDYVKMHNLEKYFVENSVVTEVTPLNQTSLPFICDIPFPEGAECESLLPTPPSHQLRSRRHTISEIPSFPYHNRRRAR